jgi:ubiquinone/menaquinone biosynthesis C-methylase UbiE
VDILDLGCSVGMSTEALLGAFPRARLAGVDLSAHFLAVARHRARERGYAARWLHRAAEATGLPAAGFDLVSAFLVFHELPQRAARAVLAEAHRLVRPGGHLALMDMDPKSAVYAKMPAYLLTLLKSTEPYLDEYFGLDLEGAIVQAGFEPPTTVPVSARHRTLVARRP